MLLGIDDGLILFALWNVEFGVVFVENELAQFVTFVETHDGLIRHDVAACVVLHNGDLQCTLVALTTRRSLAESD